MTYEELKALANIVVPLIKAGQSPYQVITNHSELNISEKTLYNYIEDGVFREFDLLDVDLRIKTKRRITKKASNKYKKREDRKYLKGRTSFYLLELKIVPIFSFEHSIEIFAVIFKFFFFFNKYSSKFSFVNSRSMPSE